MAYLTTADITDKVVTPFASQTTYWATVLAAADAALVDMAEAKGVCSGSIATPLHTMVKDWAVAWFCARVCKDNLEVANIDGGVQDKYTVKFQLYHGEATRLYNQISEQMLTKNVMYAQDRISFGTVYVS